jgi:hypothetical protein
MLAIIDLKKKTGTKEGGHDWRRSEPHRLGRLVLNISTLSSFLVGSASMLNHMLDHHLPSFTTAVRSISEQIQLVSYLRSNAFGGVLGKRLI